MSHDDATFFLAPCTRCEREVLGHRDLDQEGALTWLCARCDHRLDASLARWIGAREIEDHGFFLPPEELDRHGESGCRGGQCGVRQPDADLEQSA